MVIASLNANMHALFFLGCLTGATGKVIDGVIALSSQTTEVYLGKFSFSPYQRSSIAATFHTDDGLYFDNHPHDLTLCMFSDEQWVKFRTAMDKGSLCTERRGLASYAEKVVPRYVQVEGHAPKHDFSFSSHLRPPTNRAHYWFAVMMDCYLEEYDAHPPPMVYALTLKNGNSHLPAGRSPPATCRIAHRCLLSVPGRCPTYRRGRHDHDQCAGARGHVDLWGFLLHPHVPPMDSAEAGPLDHCLLRHLLRAAGNCDPKLQSRGE